MNPLRFAMVTTFYPPHHFGGDAIGIQRLARGLVRAGHHVTVIHDVDAYATLAPNATPHEEPEPDGLDVVRLRAGLGGLGPLLVQQTGRPVANARRLHEVLDRGGFDVVNFHNVSLVGGPGVFSYGGDAVRLYMAHEHWLVCPTHVLWRHGKEPCPARECLRCQLHYKRPPQLWRHTGFMDRQFEHIDAFIAMSEFSRDKHREFGFRRDMEVLPYFLDDPTPTERASTQRTSARPHERPYFLFVGRLERIKGLDDVIPLFARYPDADLVIAGDGDHRAELERLAAGLPNVKFLGRVPLNDLRAWYDHAISLVVPSVCFETFGIILIEAFRQRTPVIARRIGPFPEIIAQSNGGELFSTNDDLLAAMRRMQFDPSHREQLARDGYRAFLDRWTESAVIPRYLDIVRRASERRRHTRAADALTPVEVA